ncbi:MAG: hypothetical protein K9H16_02225, partial [Bacteroidales bacterium]|nr:hypothetical protein [Bacteroidales bacterium]
MRIFREKRLNKIIATLAINPFILAIPFTVLLFYLLPVEFIRFKVELIDEESTSNQYYFYDLDFDGDTEVLMFGYYRPPNIQPNIIFYETPRSQRIINQINLDDDFVENARPIFADYNHDSIAEAYIFQKTDTAIYITGIQFNDTKTDLVKFRKKHINLTYKRKGYEKLQNHEIINGHPTDLNGDGYDEIIFAVVGLFVAKPREICAFDIKNDTIFRTPKMAARLESNIKILHHPFLSDKWIFTMNTGTPANYKESEDIIDDSCGWAMAFDEKLNLWFQPIPNKVGFNYQVNTVPFQENDQAGIIALFKTPAGSIEEVEEKPEVLRKYD